MRKYVSIKNCRFLKILSLLFIVFTGVDSISLGTDIYYVSQNQATSHGSFAACFAHGDSLMILIMRSPSQFPYVQGLTKGRS